MASLAPLPWGEAGEWDEVFLFPLLWGFVNSGNGIWDLGFGNLRFVNSLDRTGIPEQYATLLSSLLSFLPL